MSKDAGPIDVANLPANRPLPSALVVEDLNTAITLLRANFEALGAIIDSFERYISMLENGDLYNDARTGEDVQLSLFDEEGGL